MRAERRYRIVSTPDLKPGDTLRVWWAPGHDTITRIEPYTGPLECLKGGRLAYFAINQGGMTLEPQAWDHQVVETEEDK